MKKIFLIFILTTASLFLGSSAALAISAPDLIAPADNATPTPGDIPFEWEPVPGAAAYYYRILNKETGEKYAGQDNYEGTKKIIPDFFASGTYKWQVGACEGWWPYFQPFGSCSAPPSERTFTIKALPPVIPERTVTSIPQPILISPKDNSPVDSLTPRLAWNWSGDLNTLLQYQIEIKGNLATKEKSKILATSLSASQGYYGVLPGLLRNKQPYTWAIRAVNKKYDFGPWSDSWQFTTPKPNFIIPPAPSSAFDLISPCGNKTVENLVPELSWQFVKDAAGYGWEVSLFQDNGQVGGVVDRADYLPKLQNTAIIGPGKLNPDNDYLWRAYAKTALGAQSWSEWCTFNTDGLQPPPPPSEGPTISGINPNNGPIGTPINIIGNNFACGLLGLGSQKKIFFTGDNKQVIEKNSPECEGLFTLKGTIPDFPEAVKTITIQVQVDKRISNQWNFSVGATPASDTTPGAMEPIQLNVDWPRSPWGTAMPTSSLPQLIQYLYEWGISLAGFAAFIVLVIAGFQYLTSAGNSGKMQEAIDRIKSAGLGIILLFGSVLILNTINPQLTTLKMPALSPQIQECLGCKDSHLNSWAKDCKQECSLIVDVEKGKININQGCDEGVDVYTTGDSCEGSSIHVSADEGANLNCPVGGKCSIKNTLQNNLCLVEFYYDAGCSGDSQKQTMFIGENCTGFNQYFEKSIVCIKVKKP